MQLYNVRMVTIHLVAVNCIVNIIIYTFKVEKGQWNSPKFY